MKWIKTAIGAVIAILVIPLVVLSVINIKESLETTEEITITIELEYNLKQFNFYKFTHTIHYDDLKDYFENGFTITNLYDHTNDINIIITDYEFSLGSFYSPSGHLRIEDNNSVPYVFYDNNVNINATYESVYNVTATDIALMDITFTKSKTNLTATLLSFTPLIFVGGVVLYFYKLSKKD